MEKKSNLYLFNTLSRKKEPFKAISKNKVGVYTCGPTVYWYQHIGNMRSYLFSDFLKRTLIYNGYKVKHVINVTDVGHLTSDRDEGEDKMELAAKKEGKNADEIANFYFKEFTSDIEKLNILSPQVWPRASKHIKEQITLIKKLEKKGYVYWTNDGVYFDTKKFKNYGKLARLNIEELQAGKRVEMGDKKHKTDFALWKFSLREGQRQQEWNSPWKLGYPGWHIECSAMSIKYLGEHFDIHTGGEDHIPVHHTNEIAQSEAATGKKFVNYWLHGAFLLSKGEKVSKSKGGLYTVSELEEEGYPAITFRYLTLQAHYRKPLDFSLDSLDAARNAYEKIKKKILELRKQKHKGNDKTNEYEKQFLTAVNDDLNMPRALEVFWRTLEDFDFSPGKRLKLLEKFDKVLGLGIKDFKESKVSVPKEVKLLIKAREQARENKDWAEADILRDRIKERGYVIEDTAKGTIVKAE